jgi:FixJ family two-component response regulator
LNDTAIIAIVDDDASARTAVVRLVRSLGFRAHSFASAEEFLFSPRLSEASCLVTDVQMPRMGGFELQRRLTAEGRRIPVIFMTAFGHDVIRERARAAGVVCVLAKPLEAQSLARCVESALAGNGVEQ